MKENMISIGLDIGTTKIVAMIGQTNEYNKMKILGVGKSISLGVHRGVVNNITQTIQSIQQAVSEAEEISKRITASNWDKAVPKSSAKSLVLEYK